MPPASSQEGQLRTGWISGAVPRPPRLAPRSLGREPAARAPGPEPSCAPRGGHRPGPMCRPQSNPLSVSFPEAQGPGQSTGGSKPGERHGCP
eukprot:3296810-Alexandrium_andersonii.AAC.1